MVNKDFKDTTITGKYEEKSSNFVVSKLKETWNTFHKYMAWLLIATAIGIYIGMTVSRSFYTSKMDDVVKVGGMVHKEHVYIVTPK